MTEALFHFLRQLNLDPDNLAATWYNHTPLMAAVSHGHYHFTLELLKLGADPNQKNGFGETALHIAALHNRPIFCKILYQFGADLNARNHIGRAPLHLAARHSNRVTICLLQLGANVNAACNFKITPIHFAAMHSAYRIYLLMQYGAYLNQLNQYMYTAVHYAASTGNLSAINLLVQLDVAVDLPDIKGNTPIMIAANFGHHLVVKQLIMHSANLSYRNKKGKTALDIVEHAFLPDRERVLTRHAILNGIQPNLNRSARDLILKHFYLRQLQGTTLPQTILYQASNHFAYTCKGKHWFNKAFILAIEKTLNHARLQSRPI